MRAVVSFFLGALLGALATFLVLQQKGRLTMTQVPVTAVPVSPVSSPPGGKTPLKAPAPSKVLPAEPSGVPRVDEDEQIEEPPGAASSAIAEPAQAGPIPSSEDSLAIPVSGVERRQLRDHFNDRRGGGRPHHAIDIMASRGTPVVAVDDGKIAKLFLSVAGGITIYQSNPAGDLMYYYAHLDRYAPGLKEGRVVQKGEVLGFVGSTGNANPAGPHLHFAISKLPPSREWWKGDPINPYPILMSRGLTFTAR